MGPSNQEPVLGFGLATKKMVELAQVDEHLICGDDGMGSDSS